MFREFSHAFFFFLGGEGGKGQRSLSSENLNYIAYYARTVGWENSTTVNQAEPKIANSGKPIIKANYVRRFLIHTLISWMISRSRHASKRNTPTNSDLSGFWPDGITLRWPKFTVHVSSQLYLLPSKVNRSQTWSRIILLFSTERPLRAKCPRPLEASCLDPLKKIRCIRWILSSRAVHALTQFVESGSCNWEKELIADI